MNSKKYAIYTGCTAKESTPELLKSTKAIFEKLNVEFEILEEASCCGASHLQDFDEFLSLVLNARNICYAEKLGLTMVTLCNTCQINLSMTKDLLDSDEELKAKVNEKLKEVGLEYRGSVEIKHLLYVLRDEYGYDNIKNLVSKPLSGFNIAPFYGCHNIRPSRLQNRSNIDENPYNPTSIEKLIEALGGSSVNYSRKNSCCGFHADLQAPKSAAKLTGLALSEAIDQNADFVVTPCPLCHLNFDLKQHHASKSIGREIEIPVLHLSQMIGLSLGISEKELGLNHNVTKATFS